MKLIKKILPAGRNPKGLFRCRCGNTFVSRLNDVRSGHTKSCGCYARKVRSQNIRKRNETIRIKKQDQ